MSFTLDICKELTEAPLHKTCCKKAMLFGLFFAARLEEDGSMTAVFRLPEAAETAGGILQRQFSATPELSEVVGCGRRYFHVKAKSRALAAFLTAQEQGADIESTLGFRCEECRNAFLRCVFVACATINDPQKGYHLEFSLKSHARANALDGFLAKLFEPSPNRVNRKDKYGVYYKSNVLIVDLLYYIGASSASFYISNVFIERDIRNAVNRETNCVARNIERAVDASRKYIEAIEHLKAKGRFDTLDGDLRATANLRCENPDASLADLARMHNPPISKSGLNRRLCKLMEIDSE